MWRRKPQRPPPTYEDVRLVAEVLSRINADLIQRHFSIPVTLPPIHGAACRGERFGDVQADGWHYPPISEAACHRDRVGSRWPPTSAADVDQSPTAPPETEYVVELEEEVRRCEPGSSGSRTLARR